MITCGLSGNLSMLALLAAIVLCVWAFYIFRARSSLIARAERDLLQREKRLQLALDSVNDGLWQWNLLTDVTLFPPSVARFLDYEPHELESHIGAFLHLVHPDDRQSAHQSITSHLRDRIPYDAEFRLRSKSGQYRWFRAQGQADRDGTGLATRMTGSITDITDRKLAEAAISRHAMQQGLISEFGQMALKNPPIGELTNHAVAVATRGLPAAAFCRLLGTGADDKSLLLMGASGWDPDWSVGRTCDAAEETEDRFIIGVREAVIIEDYSIETRFRPSAMLQAHEVRSGAEMLICGSQDAYGVLGIYSREAGSFTWENINFLRGITNILASSMDRRIADERLTYMAQFDALTGLANRSMFLDRLWHMIAQAELGKSEIGVLFIDLDRFKLVNDTLGHGAGDELLLQVARRLLGCVRPADSVGRLGGDEFTVALANLTNGADSGLIATEILAALARPFQLAGQQIYISASVGIGIYPTDGKDPDTLLKNADTAMYRAKESGRNTFQFYVAQMNTRASARLKIETELRGALERGEFLVHYQPKVAISSGRISGFEALLRWQNPERGMVPPGEFISILEDIGLIVPVGEWVVATVCRQLKEWEAAGIPSRPVAVNLSTRQFAQADLDRTIREIVSAAGVDPGLLEFELTESMLMADSEAAVRILDNLKAFGVRLSVDDFGTGYSSLAYLKRFPLDALKIDRMFIRDVTTDPDGATIVLAIINLAHSLKLEVVAEGVETDAQLRFLRNHGCDEMQGFYFARPQSAEDCTRALLAGWELPEVSATHLLASRA